MRLTKFNSETGQYECKDRAKTLAEFRAQRKALIQRLGEYEDRVEGEWIYHECVSSYDGLLSGYSCSCCGVFIYDEVFEDTSFPNKYCPDCGAKMKGENDEQRKAD